MAQLLEAPRTDARVELRRAPAPLHGGLPTLLRFMARNGMLNFKYGRLLLRMLRRKLWLGARLQLLRRVNEGHSQEGNPGNLLPARRLVFPRRTLGRFWLR